MEDLRNHGRQSGTRQTMVESSDTILINSLRMMREAFFWEKSHLSVAESQKLWAERVSEINSFLDVAPPLQPPVDMSPLEVAHSAVLMPTYQVDVAERQSDQPQLPLLDRTTSRSQQSAPMSRKRSKLSSSGPFLFTDSSRDTSQIPIKDWQANNDEPFSSFKMQRTASGRRPLQRVSELTVFEPEEYIRSTASPNDCIYDQQRSSPRQIPQVATSRLSQSSGQQSPCSNRFSFSQSPTTHMSGALTDATTLSHGMSRQDSYANSSMCGGLQMMKIQSQRSNISDLYFPEEHSPLQAESMQATSSDCDVDVSDFDHSHLLYHTGGVSQDSAPQVFPVSSPIIAPPVLSFAVEDDHDMKRSSSNDSNTSTMSRVTKRRQEQLAQSGRPIAPKLSEKDLALSHKPSTSDHQMIRVKSADGSSKELMAIARNNYSRPQKEKVKCTMCNKRPNGFRGDHELRRHCERHHCVYRKVWVCVDSSEDKNRLSKCKACCAQKEYGAYYNAAAHLRRVHFHPRPKVRKVKGSTEERRGGKGGGDSPSMEFLKSWMEEREVYDFDKIDETLKQQLFADFDESAKWQSEFHHGNNEDASDEDIDKSDNVWGSHPPTDPEPDFAFTRRIF
ncbi:hypothetical protein MMC17_008558 [Xylographa soralifera]|nr:hypothetical protein [Xylographa soralifera]